MKKIIQKVLLPNNLIGFFSFNIGFGLLIYVFCFHLEETPIAYISYCLSFYALLIFCIWFFKICKFSHIFVKKSRLYHFYQTNFLMITKTFMYFSFVLNLIYGLSKLGMGIYYHSWWFITFAVYYLLLCFLQISLVKNISNTKNEYKKLKHTGVILFFLNFILVGMILLIIKQNQIINYDGYLIYLVAFYDFYLIISTFIHVIQYRKKHGPILIASKCVRFTVAMISMISLEVAMVYQFGNNDISFKTIMTGSMGLVICFINSFMAIYMIVKANKFLN